MVRLFERHKKRKNYTLDGMWKFKMDPKKVGNQEKWFETFPEDSTLMVVPSCWNNELGMYDYEGAAWYATTFTNTSENINMLFHAVTGQAEVYLDGVHLGGHYGGFTGFNFVIKGLKPGVHSLVVSVDNTHDDATTIPLARVDWFHYGGIIRSIEVMELEQVWIQDYKIDYALSEDLKEAAIDFKVSLEALDDSIHQTELKIYIEDQLVGIKAIEVQNQTQVEISGIKLDNVKLWNVLKPNLYHVRFEIAQDDIIERIGFRQITIHNKKLMVNGKEVYIKGVNRHEDHPEWGFAMPVKLMKKDIDIIKNLGANAIRGSHYPHSKAFLDYCDQEGFIFWEEIPMWGNLDHQLQNPIMIERGVKMHEEMVKRDYHHPCIIIWGLHNEIDTRIQAAYDLTKAFADKVRSLDATRPITYATMYPTDDICYPLVDIMSINQYYGWYFGGFEFWEEVILHFTKKLEQENLQHMPIIISEFGAGAIFGDTTFEGPKWTENYQERCLDYTVNFFYNHPEIIGGFIWQFADTRTSKELELTRPRSFNNKGIVNEYRKPKLAYYAVKKAYESFL